MIISMRPHASKQQIEHVCERIREFGYKVHSIEGEARVVIGVVGVTEDRAHLVAALGQDAGQLQRDLAVAADDDDARQNFPFSAFCGA